MRKLKIKRLRPNAVLPRRGTEQSAGADLCACLDAPLLLKAGKRVSVPIGIAVELELEEGEQAAAFVFGRSGLGINQGIVPSNAVGVIDADYRGELLVGLSNHSDADYVIEPGERIAQLVVLPVFLPVVEEAGQLSGTLRGDRGFGSTGRG